jgi:hypothetical protein
MAQPIAPPFDPGQPFTEVPGVSASSPPEFDPSQPFTEAPASGEAPPFNAAQGYSAEFSLEDFKTSDEEALSKSTDFNPVAFGSRNREALLDDSTAFDKLSRIYRSKETKGTTLGQKLKSLVKGTPGAISALATGVEKAVGQFLDLTPVAVAARAAGAASVEGSKGAEEEFRKARGKMAEVDASVETAGAGTGDLIRRSGRAVVEGAGKLPLVTEITGIESKAEKSDEEWKNRLRDDVAGLEQTEAVTQGSGQVMQALGNDAATLAQEGITIDPQAVSELSVVTDPINFIPFGAAVGAVSKVGGKIVNRTIASTLDAAQATKLAETLNNARVAASRAGKLTSKIVGAPTQVVGRGIEKVGEVAGKLTQGVGTGVGLGSLLGSGDVISAIGRAALAKGIPKGIEVAGTAIKGAGEILSGTRAVPTALTVAGEIASDIAKGTAEGAVLAIPFALGARPDEEEMILGAAGVGGLARAAVTQAPKAVKAAGRAAQNKLAETIFRETELADAPSSDTYGTDPNLDTTHEATAAKLDARSQKLLNWTREAFRDSGIEVYALDDAAFTQKAGTGDAYGFSINVGERLDPKGNASPLVQIFLNGTTEALPHELYHALTEVDPKSAKQLSDAVMASWTPEQKAYFTELYNTLRNGGKPKEQWKHILDEKAIAEEAGAEVFSRLYLGQDVSNVAPNITQQAATFLSSILEKVGAPLGGVAKPKGPGVSTLGIRPGAEATKVGQRWLSNIAERLQTQGSLVSETRSKLLSGATPDDFTSNTGLPVTPRQPVGVGPQARRSDAAVEAAIAPLQPGARPNVTPPPATPEPITAPVSPTRAPTPKPPVVSVKPDTTARNVRVTRQQQNDFAAKRASETGVEAAKTASVTSEVKQHIDTISQALESGSGVVEIEHRGVTTDATASGRTARRAEQEAAYIAEGAANAPADIRTAYQKTFVPVRWENVKGKPQLLAMSLDKVIANVHRVVKDSFAKKVADRLPYEVVDGKLTDNGWGQVVEDLQAYTANQANGYRGDGNKLTRPTQDIGVSIPAENPSYNPVKLTTERMNFLNLVQGLNPPLTARVSKGTPGNIKGQLLAELQGRTPESPTVIRPEDIAKQEFKGTGRSIKETNPLRNELAAAGVPVRELIEVTERINSEDILTSQARPDIQFDAPVTDVIRAGFLPGKETMDALRSGLLPDPAPNQPTPSAEIRDLATNYAKSAGVDYRPSRNYSAVNPDVAKKLADFYESATSTPDDATVRASYQALADETLAQYKAITDAGYTIEPFSGEGEPYKSSAEAVSDIRDNKHLFFLKTDKAFGSGNEVAGNPMLADAGNGLVVNDVFRAVHDFFGHGKEGYQFGPRGEFNAWRAHSEMFTPAAQGALAAETLAQNSWVNFGKHLRDAEGNIPQKGQPGYVPVTERPFAEQKNLVIPENLIAEARQAASVEPKFLPDGKSIKEFGETLINASPSEFKPAMDALGGLTNGAWNLGWKLTDVKDVAVLKELSERASERSRALIQDGNFGEAMPMVMKGQFFREAYEAATGTASVKKAWESGRMPEGYQPPFPEVEGKALPKTDAGKALAKEGYDFDITGIPGRRDVVIRKGGVVVGEIMSASNRGRVTEADIVSATVERPSRGKGVGEAGYRELLTQLKADGVKKVGGMVVAPEPIAIRRKIFGAENTKIRGSEGEMSPEEALAKFALDKLNPTFYDVFNTIRPEQKFLPAGEVPAGVDAIDLAAIRTPSGKIYTGAWHGDALMKFVDAISQGLSDEKPPKGVKTLSEMLEGEIPDGYIEDGFTTKSGKFLNRTQALDHAEKIGQLKNEAKRGSLQEAGVLETDEFSRGRSFLPKDKTKRDSQNRPLNTDGLVDYEKFYKELTVAKAKKTAKDDAALAKRVAKGKYTMPKGVTSIKKMTGFILPDGEFVGLDTAFHEEFLAENADSFNEQYGTKFSGKPNVEERLDAINKGFVRIRALDNGRYNVELSSGTFSKAKSAILRQLENNLDGIDSVSITLLNNRGGVVDSVIERVNELEGPEKFTALEGAVNSLRARGPRFLPGSDTLPGLNLPTEERAIQMRLDRKVKNIREKFPESVPLQYRRDEEGNYIVKGDGKPAVVAIDYDLMSSPLAKEAAKGKKGPAREEAAVEELASTLKSYHDEMAKNPDVKAGSKWYSTARTRLKKLLGDDSKFFAELLGATSARTPVETNFRFAVDAYNQFKAGKFDDILTKYREGKAKWESGDIADFLKTWKGEDEPTRGQFLDWWVEKHDLVPTQSNGKKFGANSRPVLRVLDGSWAAEVQGPKTPNFAGNLSGSTFEATIDVWAMRTLHRLANEGKKDRWRIMPENETGVSDTDFFIGQKAFRKAADAIGIKPDALQAIIWFAEKDLWEKRGWTRGAGAEKSDFNSLLAVSERKGDEIRMKTPQEELAFDLSVDDIKPKKK